MKSTIRILTVAILAEASIDVLHAQWVQQSSESTANLTDVVMLDTVTAVVLGQDGSILKTTNAGVTWLDKLEPMDFAPPLNSLSFFDAMNGIAVGDESVVTTTDGGELWTFRPLPGGGKCLSALHIGPTNIYVGDDSGWVHHSLDTGNTWTSERISAWPIRALFPWTGPYVLGLPIYALTPYSLLSRREFPPTSWEETILPFQGLGSEAFDGEFCYGGLLGFIVGVQGDFQNAPAIVRKSLSDTLWRSVPTGIPQSGTLSGVSAPSADVIYVCGTPGLILKSTDGGDTWSVSTLQTKRGLNAIHFCDENRGFAVGDSGLILHTSNGGVTGADDRQGYLPMEFVLRQNYPNPFNPATTISFTVPAKSFVTLTVFDVFGREVKALVSEELTTGTHSRQWNAAGIASGVYFYRLQVPGFFETRKLVLLR